MRKRTIIICLSVLAAAALAGGAYAASSGSKSKGVQVVAAPAPLAATVMAPGPPFAIDASKVISDAANRLHVSSSALTGALKGALIDQVNAAVKAGHFPAKLANVFKQRIEKFPGLPFGPGLLGPGPMFQAHIQAAPGIFVPPDVLPAATKYLGLSTQQLAKELQSGKTLAQVAKAQGKSTNGLVQVLVTAAKAEIQKSAAAKGIPSAVEQRLLAGLSQRIKSLVNMKGPPFGPPPLPPGAAMKSRRVAVPPMAAWWFGMMPPGVVRAYVRPAPAKH